VRDFVDPRFELVLGGKLTIKDEVRHFQKRTLLGQLFDGIAAVPQNPFISVNERDRALARGSVHEGGIVTHYPEILWILLDLPQIH